MLLLLLSHFSCVRPPQTAAQQASPSLGFSRQEHWSGLPFPSPMHESEKWKWSCSVMSDSSRSHGLQYTRLLRPWDSPGKSTRVGCHCLLRMKDEKHLKKKKKNSYNRHKNYCVLKICPSWLKDKPGVRSFKNFEYNQMRETRSIIIKYIVLLWLI